MFLAQSFKKVLKQTFQEQKNVQGKKDNDLLDNDNIFELSEAMANDPSLAFLTGNSWHSALYDDRPFDKIDE